MGKGFVIFRYAKTTKKCKKHKATSRKHDVFDEFTTVVVENNEKTQKNRRRRRENARKYYVFNVYSIALVQNHEKTRAKRIATCRQDVERARNPETGRPPCPATICQEESPNASPARRLGFISLVFLLFCTKTAQNNEFSRCSVMSFLVFSHTKI